MGTPAEKSRCCSGHLTLAPGTPRRSSCSVTRTKTTALPLFDPVSPCPAGEPGVSKSTGRLGVSKRRRPMVAVWVPVLASGTPRRSGPCPERERRCPFAEAGIDSRSCRWVQRCSTAQGCGGNSSRSARSFVGPIVGRVGDVDPCGALPAVIGSADGWASPVVPPLNASTLAGAAGPWRCHAVWPEPDR